MGRQARLPDTDDHHPSAIFLDWDARNFNPGQLRIHAIPKNQLERLGQSPAARNRHDFTCDRRFFARPVFVNPYGQYPAVGIRERHDFLQYPILRRGSDLPAIHPRVRPSAIARQLFLELDPLPFGNFQLDQGANIISHDFMHGLRKHCKHHLSPICIRAAPAASLPPNAAAIGCRRFGVSSPCRSGGRETLPISRRAFSKEIE